MRSPPEHILMTAGLCFVAAACSLITGAGDLETGDQASSNNNTTSTSSGSSSSSSSGTSGGTSGQLATSSSGGTTTSSSGTSGTSGTSGMIVPGESPCKVQHTFCDDFDTGALGARWQSMRATAGTLDLDNTLSLSTPQSFRVRLQPSDGEQEALLHNETLTNNGEKLLVLNYDLRLDRVAGGTFSEINYGVILPFPAPSNTRNHGITIIDRGNGTSVFQYFRQLQGGTYDSTDAAITLPNAQWIHITLTADFTVSPPVGKLAINGAPTAQLTMNATNGLSSAWYEVGANYTLNNKSTTVVHVDNVAFDKN